MTIWSEDRSSIELTGTPDGAHLDVAGDVEHVEVFRDGVAVDVDRFGDFSYGEALLLSFEKLFDAGEGVLVVLHPPRYVVGVLIDFFLHGKYAWQDRNN
jgi:hypothetical protein